MNRLFRTLLPLAIIAGAGVGGRTLIATAPEADRTPPKREIPLVEVIALQPQDYPVILHSRGNLTPQTQGALVAEVAGRIVSTSEQFKPGGRFAEGDLLLQLDETDYRLALTIARAELAQARLTLEKSRAEAEQARANWEQLSLGTTPTSLTLHQPQLAQAEAALDAAQARLEQARRDLQRTTIRAPYAGRVLEQQVDRGQFVTRGTPLATLYATETAEVRLPITNRQARFLPLPESGRQTTITLTSANSPGEWHGKIVRSEASIDPRTRQLHVVARIDDPFTPQADGITLRIGQFVTARIEGDILHQRYRIPRNALRNNNQVLIVDGDNRIHHRTVEPHWEQTDDLFVDLTLHPGERLVTTSLPYAPEGMEVKVATTP